MKPTKNRVYCPECHRTKMLFESEDKANTFLRFNTEEIKEQNGKHPIRAYFCEACAGWHLTSVETPFETSPSEQRINEYNNQNEKIKQAKIEARLNIMLQRYIEIPSLIQNGKSHNAYVILIDTVNAVNNYKSLVETIDSELTKILEQAPDIADIILSKINEEYLSNSEEAVKELWMKRYRACVCMLRSMNKKNFGTIYKKYLNFEYHYKYIQFYKSKKFL